MTDDAAQGRQRVLSILAAAPREDLETAWSALDPVPSFVHLRRPEIGLVMVRGRMGGGGRRFNLGEVTVARCAVRLDDGTVGVGYVRGRDLRRAELVAAFDALLQAGRGAELEASLIAPLERAQAAGRDELRRKAAATRVEFFTLARGDA